MATRLITSVLTLLIGCFVFLPALTIAAEPTNSSPVLTNIMPRGAQRGREQKFEFIGERLADAEEIFVYTKGLTVKKIEPIEKNLNKIFVTIAIAADCRVGEHVVQVRTRTGISDYRSIWVGHLPEIAEVEPNNEFDSPQKIELNHTITGSIQGEDVDYFSFTAAKGDRITAEIEGIRLARMFDPYIALLDKNRFEVAVSDDSPLHKQDGVFSVLAPADGEYVIQVREASYAGGGNCPYRLHVGNFPRPTVVYPAGGKRGETLSVNFIGDPLGDVQREIQAQSKFDHRDGLRFSDDLGQAPSPIAFRLSNLENYLESEPNNTFSKEPAPATAPIALNGIISHPGDVDFFRFKSKKGQVWEIECYGRRISSGLDPIVNIYSPEKKHIVGDDDARRPDCYVRFTAPADGDYHLRVRDHLMRGQPDFVYRVEIQPVEPKLKLTIPRVDRYSQKRQTLAIARGNRFATLINAERLNFGGEIQLDGKNLPPGVTMSALPMKGNLNSMPVVFSAAEDAEIGGMLAEFRGHQLQEVKGADGKPSTFRPGVAGGFENIAEFALGNPNNARYYACKVDRLAMAVTEKLPFKLELVQPKVPLVRDGSMKLKVKVIRDEGFKSNIRMQLPFRPPGLGTSYQIVIPADKSEFDYPVNANGKAQLGKWPIYVIGLGNHQGGAWASTQLAELEIAEPYVTMKIQRVACEVGQTAELVCQLEHKTPFEGQATAEILGLPPHTTVAPQQFTQGTKELKFPIQTTAKSPLGKHKSVFCRITITQNEEPIVSTAGRCELQINKPKPAKKPIAAKKPMAPKAKAKTEPKPTANTKPTAAAKPAVEKSAAEKPTAQPTPQKTADPKAKK